MYIFRISVLVGVEQCFHRAQVYSLQVEAVGGDCEGGRKGGGMSYVWTCPVLEDIYVWYYQCPS